MDNKHGNKEQNKAKEPETVYKTIRFFDSFEEQEKAENKWLASLTPEQHLRNTTSLIKRAFAETLEKNPKINNDLTIK